MDENEIGKPIPLAVVGREGGLEAGKSAADVRLENVKKDLATLRDEIESIRESVYALGAMTGRLVKRRISDRVHAAVEDNPINAVLVAAGTAFIMGRLYLR